MALATSRLVPSLRGGVRKVQRRWPPSMHTSGDSTTRYGWFCLRTQPRREYAAAANLQERVGIEVFAPRVRVRKSSRSGFVVALAEALFPGYLFARFQYPQQLRHVVSTSGVTGVVRFGSAPPVVADGVIDFLRGQIRLADGAEGPAPVFTEGAWVRIVGGCFREVEGRVLSFDSQTARVRVLLCLLGREVQVSVLAQQLVSTAGGPELPAGLLAKDLSRHQLSDRRSMAE